MTETAPVMGAVLYYSIDFYEEKGASPPRQTAPPPEFIWQDEGMPRLEKLI
jgi:hypothetical protein